MDWESGWFVSRWLASRKEVRKRWEGRVLGFGVGWFGLVGEVGVECGVGKGGAERSGRLVEKGSGDGGGRVWAIPGRAREVGEGLRAGRFGWRGGVGGEGEATQGQGPERGRADFIGSSIHCRNAGWFGLGLVGGGEVERVGDTEKRGRRITEGLVGRGLDQERFNGSGRAGAGRTWERNAGRRRSWRGWRGLWVAEKDSGDV